MLFLSIFAWFWPQILLYTPWIIQFYNQSWARDNTTATTWPCFQAKQLLSITLCLYSFWLLHWDNKTLTFFVFYFCLWSSITLSRCRCREINQLSRAQLWVIQPRLSSYRETWWVEGLTCVILYIWSIKSCARQILYCG